MPISISYPVYWELRRWRQGLVHHEPGWLLCGATRHKRARLQRERRMIQTALNIARAADLSHLSCTA